MHISIIASGSRGDVQPYIALGLGLKAAGHEVLLVTHENFREFVTKYGLDFALLSGDVQAMLETETALATLESGKNPFKAVLGIISLLRPLIEQTIMEIWQACLKTDLIICSTLSHSGFYIAEKLKVPAMYAPLQPMMRTGAYPCLSFPEGPLLIKKLYNKLSYRLVEQVFWQPIRKIVNECRQKILDLPPLPFWGTFELLYGKDPYYQNSPVTSLCGFSPFVAPKPKDWKAWMHITGYWFLDKHEIWEPPSSLLDFINKDEPPVYIGFGSMNSREPEATTRIIIEAVKKAKKRAVVLTGWGGTKNLEVDEDIYFIDSVPHDWLFPQMSAVVHHGGAGTTSAGLRAGKPSIVIPFFGDQIFWAERVDKTGTGPKPILRKYLTIDGLARALEQATTDQEIKYHAAKIGEKIRQEDGVQAACEIIKQKMSS